MWVKRARYAGVQKNISKISHYSDAIIELPFQNRSVNLIQLAEPLRLCESSG
jgi:hypothetical protein